MPSILKELPAVTWLAGKNFTFNGKSFKVGDEVPEVNEFPRLEVFVRTRTVIPVVDKTEDLPFQFRHTVMTRERASRKLGLEQADQPHAEPNPDPEVSEEDETDGLGYNPAHHDVDEVLEFVDQHPDEVLSVYALEESGRKRKSLIYKLDKILNQQAEEEHTKEES